MRPADPRPATSVFDAIFGDLPSGWRERKGLPPAAAPVSAARNAAEAVGPSDPASPWHLSRTSWLLIVRRLWAEIGKDRVTSVAGGVTFFGLLALFPAITALVSIFGLLADRQTIVESIRTLRRFLPPSAVDLIGSQIQDIVNTPSTALSFAGVFAVLIALYSANGGTKALMSALNVAWFETERRGFVRLNLVSLSFTLGAIFLLMVMIGAIAVLPAIQSFLPEGALLISILRWPVLFAILMLALAAIYRWGPSKPDARWQWVSPGALFAAVGLIAASMLFSWYAANFANYNKTYGSLGAIVALMMWLWIAVIVVMVGAELNSEVERQIRKENGAPAQGDADEENPDPERRS